MSIPKAAVLVTGLVGAVLVATMSPQAAQAFPNKQQDCTNCHGVGTPAGTVNAVPSTTTPAAGATYTVLVTEPANAAEPAGDTGYWIANSTAAGATGLTTGVYGGQDGTGAATRTATMTAPAASGTYYYKVWAVKGSTATTGVTNFKVYSITVAGVVTTPPPSTTTTPAPTTTTTPPPTTTTTTPPPTTTTTAPPVLTAMISALSPVTGAIGDKVTITGSNFGTAGSVKFGTVNATVTSWSNTSIAVTVPTGVRRAAVTVTPSAGSPSNGTVSNAVTFKYLRIPHVK